MKLNPDCIRDILLLVEKCSDFDHVTEYRFDQPFSELSDYSHDELTYHIRQCEKAGLIDDVHYYTDSIDIQDLTPSGHEFLANIRENKIWNSVKSVASQIGSESLSTLIQIAATIITQLVKSYSGITF